MVTLGRSTRGLTDFAAVMAVLFFCEIRIPIPGFGGYGSDNRDAVNGEKTATLRSAHRRAGGANTIQGEGSLCASQWSVPDMSGWWRERVLQIWDTRLSWSITTRRKSPR